jgi:hypothetical protein
LQLRQRRRIRKIWQRISKKFQHRKGFIRHKRVTKELSRAKKLLQAKRRGGLSTARKRQHSTSIADSTADAKERKGNEKVSKDITNTNSADYSAITSDSLRNPQLNALRFIEALSRLIPPAGFPTGRLEKTKPICIAIAANEKGR